ncbi:MAG: methyltransferase [Flavobacteriales bacterium]
MFQFKQFTIRQDRCAMKVGTDGAVLGAWAKVEGAKRILDIGTGTGLLALMAAQRNADARIDAVEIDEAAAEQAQENVHSSPWVDRIRVHWMDARRLSASEPFDRVICNPPYYPGEMSATAASASIAKHSAELKLDELVATVNRLLADDGRFAVIVPANRERDLCQATEDVGLLVVRRGPLHYLEGRPFKRVLLEFERRYCEVEHDPVTVEHAPGTYTEQYKTLLEPFMLHF